MKLQSLYVEIDGNFIRKFIVGQDENGNIPDDKWGGPNNEQDHSAKMKKYKNTWKCVFCTDPVKYSISTEYVHCLVCSFCINDRTLLLCKFDNSTIDELSNIFNKSFRVST